MRRTDWLLLLLLRFIGITSLLALVPTIMPYAWMMSIHRALGLGEMPETAIVIYLARSLSAFYAFYGALLLYVSLNLEHYRALIRFLGIALVVMSVLITAIDWTAGLPWWWTAGEGPPGVLMGWLLYWLADERSPA